MSTGALGHGAKREQEDDWNSTKRQSALPAADKTKTKPKHTKLRNGCNTCKRKRLKCDETKPSCHNCIKRGISCGGYATAFRWKPFGEADKLGGAMLEQQQMQATFGTVRPVVLRSQSASSTPQQQSRPPPPPPPLQPQRPVIARLGSINEALEAASISVTGKNLDQIRLAQQRIQRGEPPSEKSRDSLHGTAGTASHKQQAQWLQPGHRAISVLGVENMRELQVLRSNFMQLDGGSFDSLPETIESGFGTLLSGGNLPGAPRTQKGRARTLLTGVETKHHSNDSRQMYGPHGPPPLYRPLFEPSPGLIMPADLPAVPSELPAAQSVRAALSPAGLDHLARVAMLKLGDLESIGPVDSLPLVNQTPDSGASSPGSSVGSKYFPIPQSVFYSDDVSQRRSRPASDRLFGLFIRDFTDLNEAVLPNLLGDFLVNGEPNPNTPRALELGVLPGMEEVIPWRKLLTVDLNRLYTPDHEGLLSPSLPLGERERIFRLYDNYTCGIMSIRNGPTENPWRTLVIPLCHDHPVVYELVAAMTCFHVACGDEQVRQLGMTHMKNAITELANGLGSNKTPPGVALIACLGLAMSECWDRHIVTGIAHLKGARSMLVKVLRRLRQDGVVGSGSSTANSSTANSTAGSTKNGVITELHLSASETSSVHTQLPPHAGDRSGKNSHQPSDQNLLSQRTESVIPKSVQFLFNTWIYFAVLARMTSNWAPDDKRGPMEDLLMDELEQLSMDREDVDLLLGVGQTLFPIINRVAGTISQVRQHPRQRSPSLPLVIVSQAATLKQQLERWKPPLSAFKVQEVEDPTWDLALCLATAEAYRFATLLYLHQAVPDLPSWCSSHIYASKIMLLLALIPTTSATCTVHIFPLLVALCEAEPGDEREWVQGRWDAMAKRMWIGNIDRAVEVMQEVWRRRDALRNREQSPSHKTGSSERTEADPSVNQLVSRRVNEIMAGLAGTPMVEPLESDNINSRTHWSTVMREWGWEILLA